MGRNSADNVWLHWTWYTGSGPKSRMYCNYCKKAKQLKNATKCRKHLIICKKTPANIKELFKEEIKSKRFNDIEMADDIQCLTEEVPEPDMSVPEPSIAGSSSGSELILPDTRPSSQMSRHSMVCILGTGTANWH
jgi:hypothetical protein